MWKTNASYVTNIQCHQNIAPSIAVTNIERDENRYTSSWNASSTYSAVLRRYQHIMSSTYSALIEAQWPSSTSISWRCYVEYTKPDMRFSDSLKALIKILFQLTIKKIWIFNPEGILIYTGVRSIDPRFPQWPHL